MKRIVAKEFLLLVGCVVVVILVALFGWLRNAWFQNRVVITGREHAEQSMVLDSLGQRAVPMRLDFLGLFEPDFVRGNCDVFLIAPTWTMDPFLTGFPRGSLTQQHVEYRKNVYQTLKYNFSDFQRTEQEFFERLDSDPAYAERVYGVLSSRLKAFKRPKEEFFSMMNVKPPFDPNKPYTSVSPKSFADRMREAAARIDDDSFEEFRSQQGQPSPPTKVNRRFLVCVAKALDVQQYFTPDRLNRLAEKCGQSTDEVTELEEQLHTYMAQRTSRWHPPADAAEVYNPFAPVNEVMTWQEVLEQKGVPKDQMSNRLLQAQSDSSRSFPLLLAMRGLLCDTTYGELRGGFDYLMERRVLRCNVDDLLFTLQNKAAPPSQETLSALSEQRATVDELHRDEIDARASLWSNAKQWAVVKWAAIVLLVLIYPLRLLVLGTRWALRTLRA